MKKIPTSPTNAPPTKAPNQTAATTPDPKPANELASPVTKTPRTQTS